MTPTTAALAADLERVAHERGDITDAVYREFFARSRDGAALFEHTDDPTRGRMLQHTLELFSEDGHLEPGAYLDWELDNHLVGYRATPAMYDAFLAALLAIVTAGAPSDAQACWQQRCAEVLARVRAFNNHNPVATP
ncbi:MAG: hypothetical protein AAF648_10030 [Pseudomonadota bacterium]